MNPEIKAQWVAALRSGDYTQGHSGLKNNHGGYCCLGVLSQLAVDQGVVRDDEEFFGRMYPSNNVTDWADLPLYNPTVFLKSVDQRTNLADTNDVYKYSFAQIADLIEEQL